MSNDLDLSEEVAASLRKYGWTPERKVDTAEWERILEAEGFTVSPSARLVLQQLGGLTIVNRESFMDNAKYGGARRMEFPALDISGHNSTLIEIPKRIGSPICPVGEYGRGDGVIYVAENGQWILEGEGFLRLGVDSEEALRHLLYGTADEIQWIWE